MSDVGKPRRFSDAWATNAPRWARDLEEDRDLEVVELLNALDVADWQRRYPTSNT